MLQKSVDVQDLGTRSVLYSRAGVEPRGGIREARVGCPLDLGTWRSLVTQ